jgi:hypothetical protein|tara:strand:- start:776 stop:1477 length:702 start_codon:yes stop_codon:yes gene_type:complete
MALGTALTAATTVSTTAGLQTINLNGDGISAVQALVGSGKLTVFLMSNEYDYEGNEPTSGGDFTRIKIYYTEYTSTGRDPRIGITMDDSATAILFAEGSGNDDDGYILNANIDDTVNWTTLRGDVDTVGGTRNVSFSNSTTGVYAYHAPGRGSDIIRDIRRSFFVFDLSGVSGTVASSNFSFYMDNFGSTGDAAKVIAVQGTALEGSTADYGNCFVADAVAVTDNATFFGANF